MPTCLWALHSCTQRAALVLYGGNLWEWGTDTGERYQLGWLMGETVCKFFCYLACALIIIYLFNQLSNMKVVISLVSILNEIYDWHGAKFLMVQISVLWWCDAMSLFIWFPTFEGNVVVSSSWVKMSKKNSGTNYPVMQQHIQDECISSPRCCENLKTFWWLLSEIWDMISTVHVQCQMSLVWGRGASVFNRLLCVHFHLNLYIHTASCLG